MRIGVVSDTHDNIEMAKRSGKILRDKGVDMIVHLGDWIAPFTLVELASSFEGKIVGVYGNNDGEKIGLQRVASMYNAELYEPPYTLEIDDKRLLLVHGWGSPEHTREIVEALASSGRWNAVLYGHTHQADHRVINGVILLNPGTASGILNKPSIAVLDLKDMSVEVIQL